MHMLEASPRRRRSARLLAILGLFAAVGACARGAARAPAPPTPAGPPPAVITRWVADAIVGQRYAQPLKSDRDAAAVTWALHGVPRALSWLSIDARTGELSGTPAPGAEGTFIFTAKVRAAAGGGGGSQRTYALDIRPATHDTTLDLHRDYPPMHEAPPPAALGRPGLLFAADFETRNTWQFQGGEAALPDELEVRSEERRAGQHALRVTCLKSDRHLGGDKWRAELREFGDHADHGMGGDRGGHDVVRWYGFSVFLPEDWVADEEEDILWQLHERPDPCERARRPPLSLRVRGDRFFLDVYADARECSWPSPPRRGVIGYEAPLVKGRWVDWVLQVRFDYRLNAEGGRGFIKVWQDGAERTTHEGPNCYNDQLPLYLKTGNYKIGWGEGIESRTHWVDEVRVGGPAASYADVAPGQ
jgi:hypothetical protein